MKNLLIVFLLVSANFGWTQKNVFLNIAPLFANQTLALNQTFIGNDGIAVEIDHFNYYISDIKLFHDNNQQTNLDSDIWLLTPDQNSLYLGFMPVNQIDSINFTIGVPKRYNTQSGAAAQDISTYAASHALSFQSPSMYWGWSFGYMHMIVGGKADSNNDNIPNAYFELHNLGNNNQQSITLPSIQTNIGSQIDLNYSCHLDRWLQQIPLSSTGVLHGEAGLNLQILQNVNTQTVFTLAGSAELLQSSSLLLSWKQSSAEITAQNLQNHLIKNCQLFANSGQKVLDFQVNNTSTSIQLEALQSGLYLIKIEMSNGQHETFRFVKP